MPACPTCGVDNAPGSRFCLGCSVPLEAPPSEGTAVTYCASCGTENSPQANKAFYFCGGCGMVLRPPPTGGEVRPIEPRREAPRDFGDLVSETFRLYRSRFWLFFMIALIAEIPFLLMEILLAAPLPQALDLVVIIVGIPSGLVLYVLVNPAIINAVAWGNSLDECYREAVNRFWTLFLAFIAVILTLLLCMALSLIIIGIPLFFYVLVSWFFYPQAVMLEGKGPLESLRCSRELVAGSRWRLLGVGVGFSLIALALVVAILIPVAIVSIFSTTAGNVVFIIATAAVTPVAYIAATLVYFELRGGQVGRIKAT